MYKRVLAALDGSRSARLALDQALKIASSTDGVIVAISVVEHQVPDVDVDTGFVEEHEPDGVAADVASVALEEADDLFRRHRVHGTARCVRSMRSAKTLCRCYRVRLRNARRI